MLIENNSLSPARLKKELFKLLNEPAHPIQNPVIFCLNLFSRKINNSKEVLQLFANTQLALRNIKKIADAPQKTRAEDEKEVSSSVSYPSPQH